MSEGDAGRGSRTRQLAGIAVSLLALSGCVWWASHQERPTLPQSSGEYAYVALALGVYALSLLLRGERWNAVLNGLAIGHDRRDAHGLLLVGYMGNTVLPARGGEFLRIFLLASRSSASRREVLGSIVSERLLDVLALGVLAAVLVAAGTFGLPSGTLLLLAVAGALVLVACVLVYRRAREVPRVARARRAIAPILRATRQLKGSRGAFLLAVTSVVWCLEGAVFALAASSLGVDVGFGDGLGVVVLASLSALIPAAPGYVGTYDAAALFALSHAGVTGGDAIGCVLLFRFVIFVPVTLVGLVVMVVRYGGLRSALASRSLGASERRLSGEGDAVAPSHAS